MARTTLAQAMISSRHSKSESGYTLIEMVSVLIIVGILSTLLLNNMFFGIDSAKSDATVQKLEMLRKAILGADYTESTEGTRSNFGFVGDIGRLPTSLAELTTQGALPAWTYSSSFGMGAGWRGPYLSGLDNKATSYQKDAWDRALTYTTVGTPSITSYGADAAAGGTSDNMDLVVTLPATAWSSTVTGYLRDGNSAISATTVEIRYPVAGVLTGSTIATDVNGYFTFAAVPFGARSLRTTTGTALGPSIILVNRSNFIVPDTAFNYFGGSAAVTYTGPVNLYSSNQTVVAFLRSTYPTTIQLSSINITWSGGGTYSSVSLNGVPQTITAAASGANTAITSTMTVPPNSVSNSLEIAFSSSKSGVAITVVFTWLNQTRTDTVTFTP